MSKRSRCIVTTSWDDGDALDLRVCRMLDDFGLKGTFYIPISYERRTLADGDIVDLSRRHEIGAHGLGHLRLDHLSASEIRSEVERSKTLLERLVNRKVWGFCYPYGIHNSDIVQVLRDVGFEYARTVRSFQTMVEDPYEMPTTVQVIPDVRLPFHWKTLKVLGLRVFGAMRDFRVRAESTFDYAYRSGGIWHLWGHSWEVDGHGLWDELEDVFHYVSGRSDVVYLTNHETIMSLRSQRHRNPK